MGTIVVSGGAGFWCGSDGLALDEYALSLTGRRKPRVCYVPTASGDDERYVQGFYDGLGDRCRPSHLSLFLPPARPPADVLADQDLIYVGGGSTPNLLAVWRVHGVDTLVRRACSAGTVLYGSSAGGLCWFESGITDSLGFDGQLHAFFDGLGLLAGSHCPHFDSDPRRRASYVGMVASGELPAGYAVDEFAAIRFDGRIAREVIATRESATAYRVQQSHSGGAEVVALQATRSSSPHGYGG